MKVIIYGGRDFKDAISLNAALDTAHAAQAITAVVHGGAPGADALAGAWAQAWAQARSIPVEVFPADWKRFRLRAGPLRNQQMADAGADACLAFPGGGGTADMVRRARAAGIPVIEPLK